jgi:hypothetical protein
MKTGTKSPDFDGSVELPHNFYMLFRVDGNILKYSLYHETDNAHYMLDRDEYYHDAIIDSMELAIGLARMQAAEFFFNLAEDIEVNTV